MSLAELVEVTVTCPHCFRPILVRAPYANTAAGVEVAAEPMHRALALHMTRGCEHG